MAADWGHVLAIFREQQKGLEGHEYFGRKSSMFWQRVWGHGAIFREQKSSLVYPGVSCCFDKNTVVSKAKGRFYVI